MTGPSVLGEGEGHPQLTQLVRQHPGHGPDPLVRHAAVWQMADAGISRGRGSPGVRQRAPRGIRPEWMLAAATPSRSAEKNVNRA